MVLVDQKPLCQRASYFAGSAPNKRLHPRGAEPRSARHRAPRVRCQPLGGLKSELCQAAAESAADGDAMLNLNHPKTPHIFRASAHLDRVLEFCKDLTLIPGPARLGRVTAVADELRALHELNRAHFGASPEIEVNIDRFKDAVERIAALPMCEVVGQSGVCPVCGKSLTITRKRALPRSQVVEPRIEGPAAVVRPGIPANPPVLTDSVEQARYCSPCLDILMPSFESLSRDEGGFGTWAI